MEENTIDNQFLPLHHKQFLPPFNNDDEFENFIVDYFNNIENTKSYDRFGRTGQKQNGLDVFSTETKTVIQCKLKSIDRNDDIIRKELLADLETDLSQFIKYNETNNLGFNKFIFASTWKNDTNIQEECIKKSVNGITVLYWSWSKLLKNTNQNLVLTYFPTLIEHLKIYYQEDEAIIYKKRLQDLEEYVDKLKRITGLDESDENIYIEIHKFLDYLNEKWDHEFKSIKNSFYPSVWKFGIGYSEFTKDKATLSIYPIMYNTNILPIKKFDSLNTISTDFFRLYTFYKENPLVSRPWQFAFEIIQKDVMKFLTERRIVPISRVLMKEYVFAFINNYRYLMELPEKTEFTLEEIHNSIKNNLFQNSHKIATAHPELIEETFFNIDRVPSNMSKSEIDKCIALPFNKQENFNIRTGSFSVAYIISLLNFLDNIDEKKISNIYPMRKYLDSSEFYFQESLTPADKVERIKGIYNNLLVAYDDFIYFNFQNLGKELAYFTDSDFMIVTIDINDTSYIRKFVFKTEGQHSDPLIKVVEKFQGDIFDYSTHGDQLHEGVEIDGKIRKLVQYGSEILSINTKGTPLLDLVHEEAITRLKEYFKSNTFIA